MKKSNKEFRRLWGQKTINCTKKEAECGKKRGTNLEYFDSEKTHNCKKNDVEIDKKIGKNREHFADKKQITAQGKRLELVKN